MNKKAEFVSRQIAGDNSRGNGNVIFVKGRVLASRAAQDGTFKGRADRRA